LHRVFYERLAAFLRFDPLTSFHIFNYKRNEEILARPPTLRETLHALVIMRLFFYRYIIRNGIWIAHMLQ